MAKLSKTLSLKGNVPGYRMWVQVLWEATNSILLLFTWTVGKYSTQKVIINKQHNEIRLAKMLIILGIECFIKFIIRINITSKPKPVKCHFKTVSKEFIIY